MLRECANLLAVLRGLRCCGDVCSRLYEMVRDEVVKLYGMPSCPPVLHAKDVAKFMKYDSGAKEFRTLQTKTFTAVTSAVLLHG